MKSTEAETTEAIIYLYRALSTNTSLSKFSYFYMLKMWMSDMKHFFISHLILCDTSEQFIHSWG